MKITSTKDKSMSLLRAHVYGDSGVGKTTSLGTLPAAKTLIVSAERGLLTLQQHDFAVVVIESWDDVRELCKKLQKPSDFAKELKGNGALDEIKVVAIDSLTELSEMCKAQIVGKDRKVLMQSRADAGKEKPLGIYDDLMAMEDWGLYQNRMKSMISAICHMQMHVIFTGLSQISDNKKKGDFGWVTPALHGQLAFTVPAYFDLVMRMESIEVSGEDGAAINRRVWRTFNDGQIIAKDGTGCNLEPFEEPDWSKLMAKIFGKKQNAKVSS